MGLLASEPRLTAGPLFYCVSVERSSWGHIGSLTPFDGVGLAGFKSRVDAFLLVYAARSLFVFYRFSLSLHSSKGWYCGAGFVRMIGCKSLSPSLALPALLIIIYYDNKNNDIAIGWRGELGTKQQKNERTTEWTTQWRLQHSGLFGHTKGNTLSDINITREDIIGAIKIISQISSLGPDEFSAILLKQCSKSLSHPLQLLYKASLKTGEIPTDLKRAIITPIYEGGSCRNLPKNYRPVALTSHLIKILEKILAKNIHQFLGTHQKMNPQATRLPLWQILPLPATGGSQQDIRGIGKVKQCWCYLPRFCKSVW